MLRGAAEGLEMMGEAKEMEAAMREDRWWSRLRVGLRLARAKMRGERERDFIGLEREREKELEL